MVGSMMVALLASSYLLVSRELSRPEPVARAASIPPAPPLSPGATWIARLNYYRELAGLAPVTEDFAISKGDANHARYLVANKAGMIRSGKIDGSIHEEDPARPFFTPEGKTAGALSDVDALYTHPPEDPPSPWAIENWMTGPFHRMWLLNPALARVGYGQYCEDGICAAALNIQSGIQADPGGVIAADATAHAPIMFPPARATIHNGVFSADEVEWPDPLAACGYATPAGIPITLQIGGNSPVTLNQYSLSRDGTTLDTCGFDAASFKSDDPIAQRRASGELKHFGGIVMVPKSPLVRGATYVASINASGHLYSWQFSVAP